MRHVCELTLLVAVGCGAVAGCRDAAAPPAPQPAASTQPATAPAQRAEPAIPSAGGDLAEGVSPVLVKPLAPADRPEARTYTQDEALPAGDILGLCYIPAKSARRAPRPQPIDITRPPHQIRNPEPGEIEYYRKATFRPPRSICAFSRDQGGHPVAGAVVMIRQVTKGPLPALTRGSFIVSNGQLLPAIGFSPVNDRVELRTYDAFSNDIAVTELASGKTIFQKVLAANRETFHGHGALDKRSLGSWEMTQWMKLAKPIRTEPVRRGGFFEIHCRRHPWQRSLLVVFDNPYIAFSSDRGRSEGIFSISKIPAGTWTIEAWHPRLEPVKKTQTVTIKQDETLELPIAFKMPPEMGE